MEKPQADSGRDHSHDTSPALRQRSLRELAGKLNRGLRMLATCQTALNRSLPDFCKGLGLALLVGGGIWLLLTAHPLALALVFAGLALWLAKGRLGPRTAVRPKAPTTQTGE